MGHWKTEGTVGVGFRGEIPRSAVLPPSPNGRYNEVMAESFLDYLKRLTDEIYAMQKSSEARIDRLTERMDRSREEFDRSCKEFDRRSEEFDRRSKEFDRRSKEFDRRSKEFDRSREEFDRSCKEFDRRSQERAREAAEADRRFREYREESQRRMDDINQRMGGVNNVQGEIAEDLFRRNIKEALKEFDMDMDEVYHNLKAPGVGEYDLVAVNGSEAVVVEIKNKLKANDIRKFYEIQLPRFKTAFPQFTNYKVYGGLGALVMSNEQETEIAAMGLFVLTQGQDGIARAKKPKIPIIL